MSDAARDASLQHLIAPVRPSLKHRYPITPIEQYVTWARENGEPFDPWIRVHVRRGGTIAKPVPRSMSIVGTVADWEQWTGMRFPGDGRYTFPEGLAPVEIDHDRARRVLGAQRLDRPRAPDVTEAPRDGRAAHQRCLRGEHGLAHVRPGTARQPSASRRATNTSTDAPGGSVPAGASGSRSRRQCPWSTTTSSVTGSSSTSSKLTWLPSSGPVSVQA